MSVGRKRAARSALRMAARTLHGHPVPHAEDAEYGDPRPPHAPAAIIPIERIRSPAFLLCGLADTLWPGCPYT